ncbi:MAG: PD40 domain-containing protein [Bacteroidetes bacterium]|nr:PD40 domain-containing protein [Bacteroidota bacterium]
MISNNRAAAALLAIVFSAILISCSGCSVNQKSVDAVPAGKQAVIRPDYAGITIPPNIAPLNFRVMETGNGYLVKIQAGRDLIQVESANGSVQISESQWNKLLRENAGQKLTIEIFVKNADGTWKKFEPIVNIISRDSIDGYLTYRKFGPLYNMYKKMGIYQRCLEDFSEKPVLANNLTLDNCMNCHNFWKNGTDRWLFHMRGGPGTAMILTVDGKTRKVDTKTAINGPTAYPSWHPSGKSIAFAVSKLLLFFHEIGECRDVLDRSSDIVVYDIETNIITTNPLIASPDRMENWPAWSPDGKYLYFCSSPKLEMFEDTTVEGDLAYDKIRYDLMRIGYDASAQTWGHLEKVISTDETGLSISEPRVSPDGRFLLFTATKYSQFPIYLQDADICILDLATGKWRKPDINSDKADSFHSWSADSKWIVFSSKRMDGFFTTPFFSHVDTAGNFTKPFILPQEDPVFYETCIHVYNAPEFSHEAVKVSPQVLAEAAFSAETAINAKPDPAVIAGFKPDEKKTR